MQRSDLERLARTRAFPAVTILLPTERRRPGNPEDPLRLRHLVDAATERLRREHDRKEIGPLIEHLERAAGSVDFAHPAAGLAIFATAHESHLLTVPFPVPERVVVNDTFATRDLLLGLCRTSRYRVLVLSAKTSRLFDAWGENLSEVTGAGFPVTVEAPREEDTPHRDLPIHESQHAEAYRFTFRAVDRALGDAQARDPLPVVLVGVERDLSYFAEVTAHADAVIGRVPGNHAAASARQIGTLAAPVADAHFAGERARAVDMLVEAIGVRRAALGLDEVWTCAREGRGRLLVVEEDYEAPVLVTGGHLEPVAQDAPGAREAVDEIAEAVLTSGGDVEFVESGALTDHGRIGLVLRY